MELVDHSPDAVLPPTFGASLRAARLSRNLTLDAVAARTKINISFLRDLERDDLSKWPANQFYRESYLRAYARAIGLDPREVIDLFRREFENSAGSGTAVPSAKPRRLTPVTIPIILAVTFAVSYGLARWLAPSPDGVTPAVVKTPSLPAAIEAAQPSQVEPSTTPSAAAPSAATPSAAPPFSIELPASPPEAAATAGPPAIEGELSISSTPDGARVLVNGINRGVTPVTVRYLPAGPYEIRVIHPGMPGVTRRATISAERRQVAVSVELEAPSATE